MKPSPLGTSLRIGLWCALALSLSSCAPHYVLTSPAQTAKLPASRGWYGGSMWVVSPWEYRGSKARTHEFFYYYHHQPAIMVQCTVSIPREEAVLHFREHAIGATSEWVDLRPDAKRFEFYYSPGQPPMR